MKSLSSLSIGFALHSLLLGAALLGCGSVDPSSGNAMAGASGSAAGAVGAGGSSTSTAGSGGAGNPAVGGGGTAGAPDASAPLLPWSVGDSWTYQVTLGGAVTLKTTTLGAAEPVGGIGPNAALMALHVTTAKGANDRSESWQAPDPANSARIVRYREQSFSAMTGALQLEEHWQPSKLHIDGSAAHTLAGAKWVEAYSETKLAVGMVATTSDVSDAWTVVSDDETLEVPAGAFQHVIHFQKKGAASSKDYWYARGVGKLKETGTQTEELTEYSVAAVAP